MKYHWLPGVVDESNLLSGTCESSSTFLDNKKNDEPSDQLGLERKNSRRIGALISTWRGRTETKLSLDDDWEKEEGIA